MKVIEPGALGTTGRFGPLPATDGATYGLDDFADKRAVAVIFIATGCPTVRAFEPRLTKLQADVADAGVQLVAINANNPYLSPGDTLEEMGKRTAAGGYNFPYLKDTDRAVARAF